MKRGLALVTFLVACSSRAPAPVDAGADAAAPSSPVGLVIARAEDARREKDVPAPARIDHDPAVRRRSARALSRIADAASIDGLVAHLADADPETEAWAAYGLGYACKGREEAHVKILAARAVSTPASSAPRSLDPRTAIARAIGRCGGPAAEPTLLALLPTWGDPALLGLGDLAVRRKQLGAEAMTALLESSSPLAFYALSRADPGETFGKRLLDVARAALARPSDTRILTVRALGKVGKENAKEAAASLVRVATDRKADPGERAEAASALGGLGAEGQSGVADALLQITPDRDAVAIAGLAGTDFHALYTLLGALGAEPPKKAEPALQALATLKAPSEPPPLLGRRLAAIRCAAALALAKGGYDAEILAKCDDAESEISEHVRLASLLRRPLAGERRAAFRAFAKSAHLRIQEEAVEALSAHRELGDTGIAVLAEALASKHAGLVATAADVLNAHPERAMVLAASEKRAALDPNAPPPSADPDQEVSPVIAKALLSAIEAKWPEDRFETRIALVEAAASVRLPQAKRIAQIACGDPNGVVRESALKALRSLGGSTSTCETPDHEATAAAEIGSTLGKPTKVIFTTESGDLAITLDPELSPITATRIASLARAGFYKGIVIHRVVPGFVVQLGDPEGDGYGGSGTSLRCETSPVPFGPLDVGMALAGRDTGSSQFFVTLARTPHLDGEYTRVGHADGDWTKVAQGDVVTAVRVVE